MAESDCRGHRWHSKSPTNLTNPTQEPQATSAYTSSGMFENMNIENSSDEPNLPSWQTS